VLTLSSPPPARSLPLVPAPSRTPPLPPAACTPPPVAPVIFGAGVAPGRWAVWGGPSPRISFAARPGPWRARRWRTNGGRGDHGRDDGECGVGGRSDGGHGDGRRRCGERVARLCAPPSAQAKVVGEAAATEASLTRAVREGEVAETARPATPTGAVACARCRSGRRQCGRRRGRRYGRRRGRRRRAARSITRAMRAAGPC
jgi:hypothetical protein